MSPPDHLYRDGRGVSQRPEDDTVAPVLGCGPFGGDPDAAAGGNDREPVVDVAGLEDVRLPGWWPQAGAGGPGAPVDEQSALRYLIEPDGAPSSPGIIGRQGAVAPLMTHDGAREALAVDGSAQYGDVTQALGQAAGGGVGADQVQFDVRVPGSPAGRSQSGMSSGLLTTTPKRSPIAARLAACSAAAGTGTPLGPGSCLVAVALATTVGW